MSPFFLQPVVLHVLCGPWPVPTSGCAVSLKKNMFYFIFPIPPVLLSLQGVILVSSTDVLAHVFIHVAAAPDMLFRNMSAGTAIINLDQRAKTGRGQNKKTVPSKIEIKLIHKMELLTWYTDQILHHFPPS